MGDVEVERIELKAEPGQTLYKVKQASGEELWIDAATGAQFTKGRYQKTAKMGADGGPAAQTDWGKILLDLHTGKIGGAIGKAIMSAVAILLVFLSLSGVYMWLKPILIRRTNKLSKPVTAQSAASRPRVPHSSQPLPT